MAFLRLPDFSVCQHSALNSVWVAGNVCLLCTDKQRTQAKLHQNRTHSHSTSSASCQIAFPWFWNACFSIFRFSSFSWLNFDPSLGCQITLSFNAFVFLVEYQNQRLKTKESTNSQLNKQSRMDQRKYNSMCSSFNLSASKNVKNEIRLYRFLIASNSNLLTIGAYLE